MLFFAKSCRRLVTAEVKSINRELWRHGFNNFHNNVYGPRSGIHTLRAEAGKFILATLIGSIQGVFMYIYFGDYVESLSIRRIVVSAAFVAGFAILPFLYKYLIKLMGRIA